MSDFVRSLIARSFGVVPVVKPRLPGIFEPWRGPQGSLAGSMVLPEMQDDAPAELQSHGHAIATSFQEERSDEQDQLETETEVEPGWTNKKSAPSPIPQSIMTLQPRPRAKAASHDDVNVLPLGESGLEWEVAQRVEESRPIQAHVLRDSDAAKLVTSQPFSGRKRFDLEQQADPAVERPVFQVHGQSRPATPVREASDELGAAYPVKAQSWRVSQHYPPDESGGITHTSREWTGSAAIRTVPEQIGIKRGLPAVGENIRPPARFGVENRWAGRSADVRSAEPTVHISIGRIEVRATPQPLETGQKRRETPVMSLHDYLEQRSRRGKA